MSIQPKNSAKSSTSRSRLAEVERLKLVKEARAAKKAQDGSLNAMATKFAEEHDLPRTTVVGWMQNHGNPMGRPRELPKFNETQILNALFGQRTLLDWQSVKEQIKKQSSDVLSRRSVMRLLNRWGLICPEDERKGQTQLRRTPWQQPHETIHLIKDPALKGTIWRIINGRGTEAFMLTRNDSDIEIGFVVDAIDEWTKTMRRDLKVEIEEVVRLIESREELNKRFHSMALGPRLRKLSEPT